MAPGSGRVHFLTFDRARLGLLPSGHLGSWLSGSRGSMCACSAPHASGRRLGSCCNAAVRFGSRFSVPVRSGSAGRRVSLATTCGTSNFRRGSSCPRARFPSRSDSSSALAPLARAASPARQQLRSHALRRLPAPVFSRPETTSTRFRFPSPLHRTEPPPGSRYSKRGPGGGVVVVVVVVASPPRGEHHRVPERVFLRRGSAAASVRFGPVRSNPG